MQPNSNTPSHFEQNQSTGAEFEVTNRVLIIHMKEDLDHHNAIGIREVADKKIISSGIRHVIFDFSKVKFMDSSGIGVIVGRYKKLKLLGSGGIAVCGVSDSIKRIFMMSGLYSIVTSYDTVKDAQKELDLQPYGRCKK